jgi:multiple antibiotic resistance protein
MSLFSAMIALLLVMDPFGNLTVFLSLLKEFDSKRRRRIIIREMLIALAVLILFLFTGKYILTALHISEPALSIAGGIILFLIALRMIFPVRFAAPEQEVGAEPIVVPLAVPLIAGPSTMATVILFSTQYPDRVFEWLASLTIAWAVTCSILIASDFLAGILGNRGLKALERLSGMILTTIAIQMLLTGVAEFAKTVS